MGSGYHHRRGVVACYEQLNCEYHIDTWDDDDFLGEDWRNGESTLQKYTINDFNGNKLGNTAVKILEIIVKNPNVTREELSAEIGITLEGIKKQLKKLLEQGVLIREGSRKAGYWRIMTNDNEKEQ